MKRLKNKEKEIAPSPLVGVLGIFCGVLGVYFLAYIDPLVWPVCGEELGLSHAYSLAIMMTTLVSGVFTPVAAKLSYGFCRRNLMAAACGCFALLCLAQMLIRHLAVLLLLRMLIGLCNAFILTVSLILVADIFPPERRGFWVGCYGALLGFAAMIVPFVGGALMDIFSWRVCFLFSPPCMLLAIVLMLRYLPSKNRKVQSAAFDFQGAVLIVIFLSALLLLLSLGGVFLPWRSWVIIVLGALAVVSGILAVVAERKKGEDAVIPPGLLKARNAVTITVASFLSASSATVVYYTLAYYMKKVLGASAFQIGVAVGLQFLLTLCFGPRLGKYLNSGGNIRRIMVGFGGVMLIVYLYLAFFLRPGGSFLLLYAVMILFGCYALVISVLYPYAAQNETDEPDTAYVCGGVHLGQALGYAVTLALVNVVFGLFRPDITAGFSFLCLISIAITAAAVIVTWKIRES